MAWDENSVLSERHRNFMIRIMDKDKRGDGIGCQGKGANEDSEFKVHVALE